jgi:hypothetical protein
VSIQNQRNSLKMLRNLNPDFVRGQELNSGSSAENAPQKFLRDGHRCRRYHSREREMTTIEITNRGRAEGESQMTPSRPARRPWTAAEQRKLDDFLRAGKTAAEIATALRRTPQAIYARLQRLDVKRKRSSRRLVEIGLKAKGKL